MFLTVRIFKNDERISQISHVFFVEPVVFKGSFCDALDSFIHWYVREQHDERLDDIAQCFRTLRKSRFFFQKNKTNIEQTV